MLTWQLHLLGASIKILFTIHILTENNRFGAFRSVYLFKAATIRSSLDLPSRPTNFWITLAASLWLDLVEWIKASVLFAFFVDSYRYYRQLCWHLGYITAKEQLYIFFVWARTVFLWWYTLFLCSNHCPGVTNHWCNNFTNRTNLIRTCRP